MKLSDIKGERVFDVIADLIDPIANIAEDKEAADLFTRKGVPEGMTAKQFVAARVKKALPPLLRGHKGDMIAILSAIEGTSPEEYKKSLNLVKLTADFAELLTDEAFHVLFTSAQSGTSSGSASESTKVPAT